MNVHFKNQRNRVIVALIIFLFTGIYSCTVQAQSRSYFLPGKSVKYLGLTASFGIRSFRINSSIPELSHLPVEEDGGSLGLVAGNEIIRARVYVAGFYYTASSVPRTIDLFESEALFNLYPVQIFSKQPHAFGVYIIAGISRDVLKFYGNYMRKDNQAVNYSDYREPYLGKLRQLNATAGIGVEYRLPFEFDFVHLFAEAKYGTPIQSITDKDAFKDTSIKAFTSVSLGVGFGMYR